MSFNCYLVTPLACNTIQKSLNDKADVLLFGAIVFPQAFNVKFIMCFPDTADNARIHFY